MMTIRDYSWRYFPIFSPWWFFQGSNIPESEPHLGVKDASDIHKYLPENPPCLANWIFGFWSPGEMNVCTESGHGKMTEIAPNSLWEGGRGYGVANNDIKNTSHTHTHTHSPWWVSRIKWCHLLRSSSVAALWDPTGATCSS